MSLFQASQHMATISSYDLKMRLDSHLSRMNCQMFSTGFSSGALGGNSSRVMLGGTVATLALMDLTAGAEVTCQTCEKDRYGRWVAIFYDPDGFDLGRNMVHAGWALAHRQGSMLFRTPRLGLLALLPGVL